jgi:hypothetical protein
VVAESTGGRRGWQGWRDRWRRRTKQLRW